jgi:tetratricopeptide (TPR) repeat protein
MDRDAMRSARQWFERVAELRPDVPIGATWTALTHWFDVQRGWSDHPETSKQDARRWAEIAVAMQDADGQAHTVLSHVYLMDRRFEEALAAGRQAIANRPSCAYANFFYGNVLHYCDEQDEAIHYIKLGMRYQPLHPPFYVQMLAAAYRAKEDFDAAILSAREAAQLSPNDVANRPILVSAYAASDRLDLAREVADEINRMDPSFSVSRYADRQPYRNEAFLSRVASDLRTAGLSD